jgi:hypothetical protein
MGRLFGLVAILIVMAAGAYIYMRQAQSATVQGAADPEGTVDVVGVRHDLMAIAQAERVHSSLHSGYAALEELRSSGDLTMARDSRGPYNYSVDVSGSGFRAVATYSGPPSAGVSRTISIDQSLQFSQE